MLYINIKAVKTLDLYNMANICFLSLVHRAQSSDFTYGLKLHKTYVYRIARYHQCTKCLVSYEHVYQTKLFIVRTIKLLSQLE